MSEEEIRIIIREELSNLIKSDRYTFEKLIQILDGRNIQVGKGIGTKIGTETSQKIGFWSATPIIQPVHIVDATDASSVITQLNLLLAQMAATGLQAAS